MEERFLFTILDKHRQETDSNEGLYVHPSNHAPFYNLRDVVLTLHDLASSLEHGANDAYRQLRVDSEDCEQWRGTGSDHSLIDQSTLDSPVDAHCTTTVLVNGQSVQFTVMEDRKCDLLFLLGLSTAPDNGVACKSLLHELASLLTFLNVDLRSCFLDAHVRSDVDGVVISAVHSGRSRAPLGDLGLAVSELTGETEDVLTALEAGDLFNQRRLNQASRNIYVIGSCLFFHEVVRSNHLPDALFANINFLMKFHRKGFRRIKHGANGTVIQFYLAQSHSKAACPNLQHYFLWTNKDDSVLGACVDLHPSSDDRETAELLDIVIEGLWTALEQIDFSLHLQSSSPFVRQPDQGSALSMVRTSRSASIPSSSKAAADSLSVRSSIASATGASPSSTKESVSIQASSVSDTANTTESGIARSRHPSLNLIYRIKIICADSSVRWDTFLEDGRKGALVPPSLQSDFLRHVSVMHARFKESKSKVEETAVMLEYPPPALIRKYWISGWKLDRPHREVFVCFPDGAESCALLGVMTEP